MSTAHSIIVPSDPRLIATSFSASARSVGAAVARDGRIEQRAPLLDVAPGQHRFQRALHPRQRDIGQETQTALVDADQRDVERREPPRDRQHRAVAAEDDHEIRVLAERVGRGARESLERRLPGGFRFDDDVVPALGEELGEACERLRHAGAGIATDERDALETSGRRGHGGD